MYGQNALNMAIFRKKFTDAEENLLQQKHCSSFQLNALTGSQFK